MGKITGAFYRLRDTLRYKETEKALGYLPMVFSVFYTNVYENNEGIS